jgi:hypothetical protein
MKFRLTYDGKLKGGKSKDAAHIHEIRTEFHRQLVALSKQEPLRSHSDGIADLGIMEIDFDSQEFVTHGVRFLPIAHSKNYLLAELEILLLRPAPPGALFKDGGDIDNRLKTLIDALRMPTPNEVQKLKLREQPDPFFCLLQDDKLVTGFKVETDTLHDPDVSEQHCRVLIQVRLWASKVTMENIGLIS